ncbi:hypothetical protein L3V77_12900 [Vibrio sp. DW001]|uniref:hypothetical protein n=1 Tax=Vibrio sp. DW001 TaxID=2912315 RepID=UPI0023AFF064|nr:hypothetical protein [Vibrio sp. DW001]WED25939.1 hypothetical protein L3V77_12900 [Vibrio sp. DW001]
MGWFKNFFGSSKPTEPVDETQASTLYSEIRALEVVLEEDDSDSEVHKELMKKYNRAVSVYASCPSFNQHIDETFEKIESLRGVIRKNM